MAQQPPTVVAVPAQTVAAVPGQPVAYAATQQVVYTQEPVKTGGINQGASAVAGVLGLITCILSGIGAGGPWWATPSGNSWGISLSQVWLCAWGWAYTGDGGTSFSTYQAYYDLFWGFTQASPNLPPPLNTAIAPNFPYQSFTNNQFNTMRAGAALLGIACVFAFFAMIFSFIGACAPNGCNKGGQFGLHLITMICAVIGTICAGVVMNNQAPFTSLSSIAFAGVQIFTQSWGYGCAVAAAVVSFVSFLIVAIGGCM